MKIYVNGKYRLARMTGVQRVAQELVRAATSNPVPGVELTVVEPPAWLAASRLRPVLALLWEQIVLPWVARDGLLLSLCNTGPVLKRQHAIVLHDAAVFDVPQNYGSRYARLQRFLMRCHGRRAMRIMTVSEFSRGRLAHWLRLAESSIQLLGLGAEHVLRPTPDMRILARLGLAEKGYLLAIGSRQPGKNFAALLEAAKLGKLDLPIVLAGGTDVRVFGYGELLQHGHLVDAGYVSDEELIALVQQARCYVQPSLYEGFGLPVLEAMALGVPVLCSRAASLPEVSGDAALYFDPSDPVDMARAMNEFLSDPALYGELSQAGRKRSLSHSWSRSAQHLLLGLQHARR